MKNELLEEYNHYIASVMENEKTKNSGLERDPLSFVNFVLLPTFEEWKEMHFGKVA